MRPPDEFHHAFARALLDPAGSPEGLDPAGRPDALRFAVYRNNVAVSLREALEAAYPATRRLVGVEFFRACAAEYAASAPPRSPVMLHYGEGFADFLARFAPLAEYPYLADVARIERAWLEAYHAAEAAPLDPAALTRCAASRVGDLRFTLHPSVRIVRSAFPALTLWHLNMTAQEPPPVCLHSGAQDTLIARPDAQVEVRTVPPGGAEFLVSLSRGSTLTEATAAASAASDSFNLAEHLAAVLRSGLLIAARLRRRRNPSLRKQPSCHRILR